MNVVSRQDFALKGICHNPLLASILLKSVAPDNWARVSSTWEMGNVSHNTLALRALKSTGVHMSPDHFGTTTIPTHQEVGSVTFVIMPIVSIRWNSSCTLSHRGRATSWGVNRECGMASGFRRMVYSTPMLPRPLKTAGNHLRMSSSAVTVSIWCRSLREIKAERLSMLAWRSLTTNTLCFVCLFLYTRTAVNCPVTLKTRRAGPL